MASNPLVGTWRLMSNHSRTADGRTIYPYGTEVSGYITYTEEGRMCVAFGNANRPRFPSGDRAGASVEEKAAAYDSFFAYAGTYDFLGDRVVHHVEVCQFANWVGTDLVRFAKLEGDTVSLTTVPYVRAGVEQTGYLVWRRVSPA